VISEDPSAAEALRLLLALPARLDAAPFQSRAEAVSRFAPGDSRGGCPHMCWSATRLCWGLRA